jgi:hypothetical protein
MEEVGDVKLVNSFLQADLNTRKMMYYWDPVSDHLRKSFLMAANNRHGAGFRSE